MKDKYLGKEGITEKYDFREKVIERSQLLGIFVGGGYSSTNAMLDLFTRQESNNCLWKVIGGFALVITSYFLGNYMHERNEKKKEKELKNIEMVLEGEKK